MFTVECYTVFFSNGRKKFVTENLKPCIEYGLVLLKMFDVRYRVPKNSTYWKRLPACALHICAVSFLITPLSMWIAKPSRICFTRSASTRNIFYQGKLPFKPHPLSVRAKTITFASQRWCLLAGCVLQTFHFKSRLEN